MVRSPKANSHEDCIHDLIWGEGIDGDREMGGAIERKAALVTAGEVGLVSEDGADVLCATAAGEGGGELDLKVDEDGAGGVQEQGASCRVLDGAAAEGENQILATRKACDGRVLSVAECRFAVVREEFGNRDTSFSLNHVICIDKAPAQAAGDERTDCTFARAHEAGEDYATSRQNWGAIGFELGLIGH
jgi:hypothetical protein